jgi:prepilin-type N-terminal cleavage/methylation domain-containing protein
MNLQNIKKMKDEKGFTIVELLIVIVVIGILVAIVIVAYTGVTTQANNSKWKANADSIRKVAEARNADDQATPSGYPSTVGEFTSTYTKLPTGVAVNIINTVPTNNAAYNTSLQTAAKLNPSTFDVDICGTNTGLKIYYPIAGGTTAGVINVGDVSSGC